MHHRQAELAQRDGHRQRDLAEGVDLTPSGWKTTAAQRHDGQRQQAAEREADEHVDPLGDQVLAGPALLDAAGGEEEHLVRASSRRRTARPRRSRRWPRSRARRGRACAPAGPAAPQSGSQLRPARRRRRPGPGRAGRRPVSSVANFTRHSAPRRRTRRPAPTADSARSWPAPATSATPPISAARVSSVTRYDADQVGQRRPAARAAPGPGRTRAAPADRRDPPAHLGVHADADRRRARTTQASAHAEPGAGLGVGDQVADVDEAADRGEDAEGDGEDPLHGRAPIMRCPSRTARAGPGSAPTSRPLG